jgi:cell division protein ZapA (FtsZ GTPase activity inhibitor)
MFQSQILALLASQEAGLNAHKAECLEDRERTRDMFKDLREDQKATEQRLEKALTEVANRLTLVQAAHQVDNQRRFDKLESQVGKITGKLAGVIAGIAVLMWAVEHFHILLPLSVR